MYQHAVPALCYAQTLKMLCFAVRSTFCAARKESPDAIFGVLRLRSQVRLLEHFQDLQTRPQSQRLQIFDLLSALMSRHRKALQDLGNEAIIGITDLVAGEKDPRNLMIVFSVLKVVMVEWDISGHAEVCSAIDILR